MSGILRGAALALVLALPLSAPAHGLHRFAPRSVSYYYPVPVVWVPAQVVMYAPPPDVCPPIVPPTSIYAQPVPAPPSGSPVLPGKVEPPMPKIPDVSESRSAGSSYFDAYPAAARDGVASGPPSVRVWNLSGRELTVRVDGQTRTVRHGQNVRLTVPRQFVWQVVGREPQSQRILDAESALEIIVRR
jgi:hypothetical protein